MKRNILDHFFVGDTDLFSDFFRHFDIEGFPRFNVVKLNEGYKIEIALPGWTKDNIKVHQGSSGLVVEGEKLERPEDNFLHKGISGKAFKRTFFVPETLEVVGIHLQDGILSIHFHKRANKETKYIEIK